MLAAEAMADSCRSAAFNVVHLLASLTSIAACLVMVAWLKPQAHGRWPILAGSGWRQLVTSAAVNRPGAAHLSSPPETAPAAAAGIPPNPLDVAAAAVAAAAGHSLQECLEAAREGHWRRVVNTL